ncbi:MAG: cytochrome P450 [Streptosporangiales bacterium]|nr:cytochrome P450 [Streptosporangiales bacterium]
MPSSANHRNAGLDLVSAPTGAITGDAVPLYGEVFSEDQHGLYERLRREWGPVAPVLLEPGLPAWLVLGYYEVLRICRTPRPFSRDTRRWRELQEGVRHGSVPAELVHRPGLAFAEGEEHERLRRAVSDALERLDPAAVARHVREIAGALIDRFAPDGHADLVRRYAHRLPPYVLTKIVGVPDGEVAAFAAILTREVRPGRPDDGELERRLLDLVELRRGEPGEDLTSWLIEHPSAPSDKELVHLLRVTLRRGDRPTADLLASALRWLVSDREFGSAVAAHRLGVEDAIDQVLWVDPPVQNGAPHVPTQDARIGRADIGAGDLMVMSFAAANADPVLSGGLAELGHAGLSGRRAHLAWGAGPHRCPAQRLARMIAGVGVEVLLDRLTGLRLEGPAARLDRRPSPLAAGLVSLPVLFEPAPVRNGTEPVFEPAFSDPFTDPEQGSSRGRHAARRGRWFRRS